MNHNSPPEELLSCSPAGYPHPSRAAAASCASATSSDCRFHRRQFSDDSKLKCCSEACNRSLSRGQVAVCMPAAESSTSRETLWYIWQCLKYNETVNSLVAYILWIPAISKVLCIWRRCRIIGFMRYHCGGDSDLGPAIFVSSSFNCQIHRHGHRQTKKGNCGARRRKSSLMTASRLGPTADRSNKKTFFSWTVSNTSTGAEVRKDSWIWHGSG